jgi:hypothetical protein
LRRRRRDVAGSGASGVVERFPRLFRRLAVVVHEDAGSGVGLRRAHAMPVVGQPGTHPAEELVLRSWPNRECQKAPWSAVLPSKYMIHGTSSIEYGPSVAVSLSIVAETCFSRTRNSPGRVRWSFAGSSSSCRPLETSVAKTGLLPSNATSVCLPRFTSIHRSPGATSLGGGPGFVTVPSMARIHQPSSVSQYSFWSTSSLFPVSGTMVKRSALS